MSVSTSETFHVVNARGVVVSTFDNAVSARKFARSECDRRGPLSVVLVSTTIAQRRIGRPFIPTPPAEMEQRA